MLHHLTSLICLFAVAAAQQTIYCDSFVGTIRLSDFYLVTLKQSDSNYAPGLICEFSAETSTAAFLVEIETFSVSSAALTISSGSAILLSSSRNYLESYRKAIVTPSSSLRVRFDARGDYSFSRGIRMRVRIFDNRGCPANWQYMYGNCFGASSVTGRMKYVDAQRACNSMRSNLLHIPSNYLGSIGSFMRMLPSSLKLYNSWIGLTDRSSQYRHYWLNFVRQYSTSEISCVSGGSYLSCFSNERCATFRDKSSLYAIFMDDCSNLNDYACSMPPGGTSIFYSVPNSDGILANYSYLGTAVIWCIITGCLVLAGFTIGAVYFAIRRSNMRRTIGGASVAVTPGRVTVPPPAGSYPGQPPQYPAQPPHYPAQPPQYPAQPPQYPAYYPQPQVAGPLPPDYTVAAGSGGYGGGYGNMGYVK